jgi:hypothetical protein
MADQQDVPPGYHYEVIDPPAGLEHLKCRLLLSDDFARVELPPEAQQVDFAEPAKFLPLAVFSATYAPLVIVVSARPAYDDGALAQWLAYLCSENKQDRGEIERIDAVGIAGVVCDAAQLDGDGQPARSRLSLFCDGGRLFSVSGIGAHQLWQGPGAESVSRAIRSFELASTTGTTTPLFPNEVPSAKLPAQELTSSSQTAICKPGEWAALVLDDAAALDPEDPMNVRLRDAGAGFVPNVMYKDLDTKSAKVALGSLRGYLTLPAGWRCIDDGKRTLVFDRGGKVQINLNLRHADGARSGAFATSLLQPYLEQQPELQTVTGNMDGIDMAGVIDANIEGETLCQAFLVRPTSKPDVMLVARTTGKRGDFTAAMNLAGDLVARAELLDG